MQTATQTTTAPVTTADLDALVAMLAENYAAYRARMGYTNAVHDETFSYSVGPKFAKVYRKQNSSTYEGHGSIVAFVDRVTGAIYKPASFNAPAKGVRGYLHSAQHGREAFGEHDGCHVRYLR